MAKKKGGESSVGLIVTLVFFILLSIGLGVSTYYGYTQQADLTIKATAADNLRKDADARADWYQFQSLLYRTWIGQTDGMDKPSDSKDAKSLTADQILKLERDKLETGQLGKDSKGDLPDKGDVVKLIAAQEAKKYPLSPDATKPPVMQTMAFNKDKKRPNVTYEDIYKGLLNLNEYQTTQTTAAVTAKDEADAAKKKSDDEKTAAQKAYFDEVARLTAQNNKDLADERKANQQLRDDLDAANKQTALAVQKGEDDKKEIQKGIAAREAKIKELTARISDLTDRVAQIAQKTEDAPSSGKAISTDWKIVRMDPSGKKPFINLGLADNVRSSITFSIHGQGPDGRPIAASKGTLEVIDVLTDHMSQAQVVSVKDALKDPILPGDYLYNPIFRPSGEQHVVVAGRIDMHGTKGDDFEEFQRLLKRQNVVLDGYVDPQDGSIKGKVSVGTDYLVLGDLDGLKDPVTAGVKDMQNQARNIGVKIVGAREFLDSIGYQKP